MFCKYSEIFGKPGEGAHAIRIFDIAIVDVIMTIIGSYILHYYLIIKYFDIPFYYTLIGGFVSGIISHRLFCVNSTVDKLLFGE